MRKFKGGNSGATAFNQIVQAREKLLSKKKTSSEPMRRASNDGESLNHIVNVTERIADNTLSHIFRVIAGMKTEQSYARDITTISASDLDKATEIDMLEVNAKKASVEKFTIKGRNETTNPSQKTETSNILHFEEQAKHSNKPTTSYSKPSDDNINQLQDTSEDNNLNPDPKIGTFESNQCKPRFNKLANWVEKWGDFMGENAKGVPIEGSLPAEQKVTEQRRSQAGLARAESERAIYGVEGTNIDQNQNLPMFQLAA